MSLQIGNNKIKEIYYGSGKIKEVYHGSQLIYKNGLGIGDYIAPYGIIYHIDSTHYYIVSMTYPSTSTLSWGPTTYNISIPDYTTAATAATDWSGKTNTNNIISSGQTVPAASACYNYTYNGAFPTNTFWLPSGGEINALMDNFDIVNPKIAINGGTEMLRANHHSSTENSEYLNWNRTPNNAVLQTIPKNSGLRVRPITKIPI